MTVAKVNNLHIFFYVNKMAMVVYFWVFIVRSRIIGTHDES